MSVSVANVLPVPYRIAGNKKKVVYDVTCDNKYLEGGETLAPATVGLSEIEHAECTIQKVGGTVNVASASWEASKLHLYDETPAEVASEADVSNIVVRLVAEGH